MGANKRTLKMGMRQLGQWKRHQRLSASWETPDSFTATTTDYAKVGYSNRSDKCTRRVNQDKIKYTRDDANGTVFHTWIYDRISLDIRGLKAGGSNWNNSINLRVGSGGKIGRAHV